MLFCLNIYDDENTRNQEQFLLLLGQYLLSSRVAVLNKIDFELGQEGELLQQAENVYGQVRGAGLKGKTVRARKI